MKALFVIFNYIKTKILYNQTKMFCVHRIDLKNTDANGTI